MVEDVRMMIVHERIQHLLEHMDISDEARAHVWAKLYCDADLDGERIMFTDLKNTSRNISLTYPDDFNGRDWDSLGELLAEQ